jgi:capsular exopolysaccharide synthesis family protein
MFDTSRSGAMLSDDEQRSPLQVHLVLAALRCWWHIALPVGLLLASGAVVAVYYLTPATYTASAWLFIREMRPILVTNALQEDPRKFRFNQIELMKSRPVLSPIVSDPAVAATPELLEEPDPVSYLRNRLRIRTLGESDYYVIEFTSRSPEKAAMIVNKVADEYYSIYQRHESKITQETIAKLIDHQVNQQKHVENLRNRVEKLAKEVQGKADLGDATPAQRLGMASPMVELESQLLKAQLEQLTKSVELEVAMKLAQDTNYEPSEEEVEARVAALPEVLAMKAKIAEDKARAMAHRERLAPAPPGGKGAPTAAEAMLANMESQIAAAEAKLQQRLAELRVEMKAALEKFGRAKRQEEVERLQAEKQRIDLTVTFLQNRLGSKQQEQREVAGGAAQLEFAKAEYDLANKFLNMISERIMKMQTEIQAPERIQIFQYATTPTRPDEAVPYKKMGMAAMAALLAPFALAVGIEMLYRRVTSRQQIESLGTLAVVGEVTALPSRYKNRASDHTSRERQLFEESIDGLRTYLSLVETMRGRKVLAVTSAISREGKTSLAAQLAVSIASATRRPTLLIDGDLRSPDLHRIFDVDRGPGLSEVLQGECTLQEAIETGLSETLHLLTAGHLAANPHHVLGCGKFEELLEQLRGLYDHIVLDTPPILPASEALLMARAADAAVICVRRDYSRVDQVATAMTRLRATGVQTVGAVLNGIPPRSYAYRYGSYYYHAPRERSGNGALGESG